MKSKNIIQKYVAFLRGINVGGHHKVPMADLRNELEKLDYRNVITLLNSENIIFETKTTDLNKVEDLISNNLEQTFGFPIPTIIRKAKDVQILYNDNPFKDIIVTKETRLYISLSKQTIKTEIKLPWKSADNSFKIIKKRDKEILSVLDLSVANTPKSMVVLEKLIGKNGTTRNWKTIERIVGKF